MPSASPAGGEGNPRFWGVLGGVQDAGDIHGVGSKGGAAFPGLAVWAGALEVVLPPDVHSFVLASGLAR